MAILLLKNLVENLHVTFLGVGIILNSPSKLVFAFFVHLLVCIGHSLVFIGQTIVIYRTIYIYIYIYLYIYTIIG